ncbi:hypothetical protein EW146_g9621 [Bondarzewia mesenterica]|uniref:Uncharacterized protein n=1 Tax=Bondarzewia mesenterica TaxID=1095465 RepID=A0A4S4L4X3_9AGAM|nr:hypothetical protein EW146_g9621 [Bondarzewia mesenterica]
MFSIHLGLTLGCCCIYNCGRRASDTPGQATSSRSNADQSPQRTRGTSLERDDSIPNQHHQGGTQNDRVSQPTHGALTDLHQTPLPPLKRTHRTRPHAQPCAAKTKTLKLTATPSRTSAHPAPRDRSASTSSTAVTSSAADSERSAESASSSTTTVDLVVGRKGKGKEKAMADNVDEELCNFSMPRGRAPARRGRPC